MTYLLILALALGTYATRSAGHLVLSRFERVDPRVEAALEAMPAAVLTALVAPAVFVSGAAEVIAAAVTVAAAMRMSLMPSVLVGAVTVALLRAAGL